MPPVDPFLQQSYADALLDRTARELSQAIHEMAAALRPFPPFLGLATVQAVEVEPAVRRPDLGCVVVCPDGELYELKLRLIPGALEISDLDQVEEFKELELPPLEYIPYAYQALQVMAKLLQEQQARGR